ncbi:MAG: MerR family transcriptional regulator [Desulfarculus sp.]|nr:MerR family transcriptional regulator [Desulfarculus sp.]
MAHDDTYTVGRLARRCGLSRSTLLYYDSIGLLRPSRRSQGDYRRYSQEDARRLEQICLYRQTGLSLADIAKVLEAPDSRLAATLERRLEELNQDIARLREQQRFILGILKNPALGRKVGVMNRQTWVWLLTASGFSPEDMRRWHLEFERLAPDKHQQFMEFLCIPAEEIAQIRQMAQDQATPASRPGPRSPVSAPPA